jgi:hypothetical protein
MPSAVVKSWTKSPGSIFPPKCRWPGYNPACRPYTGNPRPNLVQPSDQIGQLLLFHRLRCCRTYPCCDQPKQADHNAPFPECRLDSFCFHRCAFFNHDPIHKMLYLHT